MFFVILSVLDIHSPVVGTSCNQPQKSVVLCRIFYYKFLVVPVTNDHARNSLGVFLIMVSGNLSQVSSVLS